MDRQLEQIICEVEKVIVGKRPVIEATLMALLAGGHILLSDVPGVGKTTLAVALSKALGLQYRRVQFTPDVLPSDIVGFSMYDRSTGAFRYIPGATIDTNLLLADEINRTSSKTQSALLEAMEEGQVTVDGTVHPLSTPFCVIATQNQVGTAGTQPLPHAQMDRFLVQLTMGYPDYESQMELIRDRQTADPMDSLRQAATREEVLALQERVRAVHLADSMLDYITRLAMASREHPLLQLGISPRGALGLSRMVKASAYLQGRDYAVVEDVQAVFAPTCTHRVILNQKGRLAHALPGDIIQELLAAVKVPNSLG